MVELSTRKREIRGDGGKLHEKLGLRKCRVRVIRPSPIRQVRVPIRSVISPIRGLPNPSRQVMPLTSQSRSYPSYHSHLLPPSLSFSSTTLPSSQQHKVKSSLSISPCHDHELTLSAAYTECSIHRVPHELSTAYTSDGQSSHYSLDVESTPECRFSFRRTSLPIDRHQPVVDKSFNGKVTSSHSHGFKLTKR